MIRSFVGPARASSPDSDDAAAQEVSYGRRLAADADRSLDDLSTEELHDLAVRRARRHLDVRFLWQLMEVLPVAEAAAGDLREAEADVATVRAHLDDVTDAGRGEVAELLRPFYLEYLKKHGVKPP